MTHKLNSAGYAQTKAKLASIEQRLERLVSRKDLSSQHQREAKRSCEQMISQYRREIKLYEAEHPEAAGRC